MNTWAKGFFGRETIADWQKQLDFTTKIFRARGLHLDDRHVRHAGGESFSASIVDLVLYVANNQRRLLLSGASVVALSAEDSDRRRSRAVERHAVGARASSRSDRRDDQGLRARRADRSVLPVDGNPRRARAALRRLQHRPLGLHQQRVGRDGLGCGFRQPEHRRDHDDLRLHAESTRTACAAPSTRRTRGVSTRCGRAAWSRTFRSARKRASPTR